MLCSARCTIAAEQTRWKFKSQMKILAPQKKQENRHCRVLHLRRALQLLISPSQQTHQDGRFDIISSGGRTAGHRELYSIIRNMILRVTLSHWKTKLGDNSCEFGPQPITPAHFYRQVFHRHMLTGSSCTMRPGAQIRNNTEMPIHVHNFTKQYSFCITRTTQNLKKEKSNHSFLSFYSLLI